MCNGWLELGNLFWVKLLTVSSPIVPPFGLLDPFFALSLDWYLIRIRCKCTASNLESGAKRTVWTWFTSKRLGLKMREFWNPNDFCFEGEMNDIPVDYMCLQFWDIPKCTLNQCLCRPGHKQRSKRHSHKQPTNFTSHKGRFSRFFLKYQLVAATSFNIPFESVWDPIIQFADSKKTPTKPWDAR